MRRKKKKKRKDNGEDEEMTGYLAAKCEHPLVVKVGERKIVVISWKDYEPQLHAHLLNVLDVFIGLDSAWARQEARVKKKEEPFVNVYLGKVLEKYMKYAECKTILGLEMKDRSISIPHFYLCRDLLDEGKKIGFGCYAGHGRTGWLLGMLIQHYEKCDGDEAVRRVRKRFCPECVESSTQIKSLGCKKELGADETKYKSKGSTQTTFPEYTHDYGYGSDKRDYPFSSSRDAMGYYTGRTFESVPGKEKEGKVATPMDNVINKSKSKKAVDTGEKVFKKAGLDTEKAK